MKISCPLCNTERELQVVAVVDNTSRRVWAARCEPCMEYTNAGTMLELHTIDLDEHMEACEEE